MAVAGGVVHERGTRTGHGREPDHRKAKSAAGDETQVAALEAASDGALIAELPTVQTGAAWNGSTMLRTGEHGPLLPPRDDLLTHSQAKQMHTELLAGHAQPDDVPQWALDKVDIADSGCGTSFGNRREQFQCVYEATPHR